MLSSLNCTGEPHPSHGTGCPIWVPVARAKTAQWNWYQSKTIFWGRYHFLAKKLQCNSVPVHGKSIAFVVLWRAVCALLCKDFEFVVVVLCCSVVVLLCCVVVAILLLFCVEKSVVRCARKCKGFVMRIAIW